MTHGEGAKFKNMSSVTQSEKGQILRDAQKCAKNWKNRVTRPNPRKIERDERGDVGGYISRAASRVA